MKIKKFDDFVINESIDRRSIMKLNDFLRKQDDFVDSAFISYSLYHSALEDKDGIYVMIDLFSKKSSSKDIAEEIDDVTLPELPTDYRYVTKTPLNSEKKKINIKDYSDSDNEDQSGVSVIILFEIEKQ